jgi:hypothetical protein
MNNNPYILEQLANDKLAALRAEGMRSQQIAQAGLQNPKKLVVPDLLRFFSQMLVRVTRNGLRRIELLGARKTVADC